MDIFFAIVAVILAIIGIIGCFIPFIPGNVISYVGLICLVFTDFSNPGWLFMTIMALVTLVVILADLYLPAVMTRKFGGTRAGAVGATLGVIGSILFAPTFGPLCLILGPFFGAVLGELTRDRKNAGQAFKSGLGSFLAFLMGTGLKFFLALFVMIYIIAGCWGPMADGAVAGFDWVKAQF